MASTNWQDSVPQDQRNNEISKIATELSKLEQNATMQSKLGLASKFENAIFTSATSLEDYHKIIQKRLKKMKKRYNAAAAAAAATEGKEGSIEEEIAMKKRHLRLLYGDTLRLIAENGKIAAAKYPKLIDHIDKSNENATEIGAIKPELSVKIQTGERIVLEKRSPQDTIKYLDHLEKSLEQKTDTLREWILKFAKEEK